MPGSAVQPVPGKVQGGLLEAEQAEGEREEMEGRWASGTPCAIVKCLPLSPKNDALSVKEIRGSRGSWMGRFAFFRL